MSAAEEAAEPIRLDWLDPTNELEVVAVIHATVDLERALAERGVPAAAAAAAAGTEAVADELLGARVVVLGEDSPRTAIAEPSTEGRLAAILARHDEGIAGAYVRSPFPLSELRDRATAADIVLSRPASGPFGAEVLVVGTRLGGRQTVLVEPGRVPSPR